MIELKQCIKGLSEVKQLYGWLLVVKVVIVIVKYLVV